MTFLAPAQPTASFGALIRPLAQFRRGTVGTGRRRSADEDGARKALGSDAHMPVPALAGASLEHLARIALG